MRYLLTILMLFIFGTVYTVADRNDIQETANKPENLVEEKKYNSPISIDYLRTINLEGSNITIEQELPNGSNYRKYIASYKSEGNKIFGLLTIPSAEMPDGGYSAIVFNHGYIPPKQYVTTEKYTAYVDYLARNGFVVFKIDLRGHGNSEGIPSGSYFSPAYAIDAINALKSLQKFDKVNPQKIGMWGHSMAGNLVLRAMLISGEIKAGAIWAGAVYSYKDFMEYRLNDSSYVGRPTDTSESSSSSQSSDEHFSNPNSEPISFTNYNTSDEVSKLRNSSGDIDLNNSFWTSVSLTKNIEFLQSPLQIQHAVNDPVVNVGYSRDLVKVLKSADKDHEYFEYEGGGHNIDSPYFEIAMQRTVDFFKKNL